MLIYQNLLIILIISRPRTPTTSYRDPHDARLSEPLTRRRIHINTPGDSQTLKGSLKKPGESVTRRNSNIYRSVELTERIGVEEWRSAADDWRGNGDDWRNSGIEGFSERIAAERQAEQYSSEVVVTSSHLGAGK